MNKKLYDVTRDFVHLVSGYHDVQWSHLGTIWATAWISDEEALLILTKWPDSISIIK